MSNENINVHTEDPKPAAAETATPGAETTQNPTAEQPKPDAGTPAAEPKPEMPKDPRAEEPAAVAAEEKGIWDKVTDHFSENWDKYAIGGGALAIGFVLGYAIAKKGSSTTESAPVEA